MIGRKRYVKIPIEEFFDARWLLMKGKAERPLAILNEAGERAGIPGSFAALKGAAIGEQPRNSGQFRVAIVIGHNEFAGGAYAGGGIKMNEYKFNSLVADQLVLKNNENVVYKIFRRRFVDDVVREIKTVYAEVDEWDADFIAELHFNGTEDPPPTFEGGTEMLYAGNNPATEQCAQILQETFLRGLGLKDRGIEKRERGNGSVSLLASNTVTVLLEPFFGDSISNVRKVSEVGLEDYTNLLHSGIMQLAPILMK